MQGQLADALGGDILRRQILDPRGPLRHPEMGADGGEFALGVGL